jgi:DNA-binding NarL/FixJ family response regulator
MPRVLGVDDWAWRRGQRYGTIVVDLERNRVVDLLADRQAETLAAWLRQHPGVEVVARDRAGAYADGIRQGAPQARQVADRWHLLRNLGQAVQAIVDGHHGAVRRVAKQVMEALINPAVVRAPEVPGSTAVERRGQAAYARRQARYEEAARLHTAGVSLSRIAQQLGTERKTVRRWLRAGGAPHWAQPARRRTLGFPGRLTWNGAGPRGAAMPPNSGVKSWPSAFPAIRDPSGLGRLPAVVPSPAPLGPRGDRWSVIA